MQQGAFNLFVDEGPATRHMLYRLYFADATGRPLTLAGFKDVRPGPLDRRLARDLDALRPDPGRATSRSPTAGRGPRTGLVGSGILRIRPLDFAWQLTTFRVRGPTWAGRLRALDAFGQLFMSELWQVFDPMRRQADVRHD